ncbi:MAG: hypothetical protein ABIA67_01075 [Candidatus Margulisiibacteriota bacterium]
MLGKISHYPAQLTSAVRLITDDPLRGHRKLSSRSTKLLSLPSTARFHQDKLSDREPAWATAILGPCIFLAVTAKDEQGKIMEARAGHFSTTIGKHEIDEFMRSSDLQPERTTVWIAGLAQKTCRETLQATSEKLVEHISLSGIPLDLHWQAPNRPVIRDTRTGYTVSDIGLGMISENKRESIGRQIAFGIAETCSLLISTPYASFPPPGGNQPLFTNIFTEDAGRL